MMFHASPLFVGGCPATPRLALRGLGFCADQAGRNPKSHPVRTVAFMSTDFETRLGASSVLFQRVLWRHAKALR